MAEPNPTPPVLSQEDVERFWSKVDRRGPDECWPWKSASTARGTYGKFTVGKKRSDGAHRVAYFLRTGEWPPAFVCHTCDFPPCCNHDHLFAGTCKDNLRDCAAKGRRNLARGERVRGVKMTPDQVQSARRMYLAGGHTHQQVANHFGVTRDAIGLIVRGKNWAHLPSAGSAARSVGAQNKSRATAERNHRTAKLTDDDVRQIKRLKAEGTMMQKDIALRFGVTASHVSLIVNGKFKPSVT